MLKTKVECIWKLGKEEQLKELLKEQIINKEVLFEYANVFHGQC